MATSVAEDASLAQAPLQTDTPYVGLRPYESREGHLLFGRDRDAQFLTDKILSAKITVLYGQSGLGKSSLLRARVVPLLEENMSRVIYFDAWSGDEPDRTLKDALIGLATQLGVPDAAAGSPNLTELVRLIDMAEEGSVVLILDQFEEFLVMHGERLDPLRKELAALERATDLDVQVVFSLREEFLAALEPFKAEILSLFSSTYRLEPLDEKGLREAIERPAGVFGVEVDPTLIDSMLQDLGHQDEDETADRVPSDSRVELPMLQLVCSQLWTAWRKRSHGRLDRELYESLGGARRILDDYVLGVMPVRWRDKVRTARLMKLLAPPSGLKMSYSVDDLASTTEIDEARVAAELQRLSDMRILRPREYRSGRRYELQHDALIQIVSPWRNQVLRRARLIRRGLGIVALVGVAIAMLAASYYRGYREARQMTDWAFADLRKMPPADRVRFAEGTFDKATIYLLFQRGGPGSLTKLQQLLASNHDLLPPTYGLERSGIEYVSFPDSTDWPLTLHYSAERKLNWAEFAATWQSVAKFITTDWGIPVPRSIHLIDDPTYPPRLVRLVGLGAADTLRREIALNEAYAFIAAKDLPQRTAAFKKRFDGAKEQGWDSIPGVAQSGPWLVVPRWSLPVWKVSGHVATDGSGLVAFLLAAELLENPEPLLSDEVVERLLQRASGRHPRLVAEARAARGSQLRQDLIGLVKRDQSLAHLPNILDALAGYPDVPSPVAVSGVVEDLVSSVPSLPSRLRGPWSPRPVTPRRATRSGSFAAAYDPTIEWLPPLDSAIRVYVGSTLEPTMFRERYWETTVVGRMGAFRDDFFRRFGMEAAGAHFYPNAWDADTPPDGLRIEMLNQSVTDDGAGPLFARPEEAIDTVIQGINDRAEAFRTYWLTPDEVHRIFLTLDPSLQRWLQARYSLTDIKLLLRAVVAPDSLERDARSRFDDSDSIPISPAGTIRHHEWLLRSLVFWSALDDVRDLGLMAGHLRDLQALRVSGQGAIADAPAVADVDVGLALLRTDDLAGATEAFRRALRTDRSVAARYFAARYTSSLLSQLRATLDASCGNLQAVLPNRERRVNLADLLATNAWPTDGGARRARLCQLAGLDTIRHRERSAMVAEILSRHPDPEVWPPEEALWFGLQLARHTGPAEGESRPGQDRRFLESAFRRIDTDAARAAFTSLVDACGGTGPKNRCWDVAERIAQLRPESRISLRLAHMFSFDQRPSKLRRAIELADQTSALATPPGARDRALLDSARFARANALVNLSHAGDTSGAEEGERILSALVESPTSGFIASIFLASRLIDRQRYDEARDLLVRSVRRWPGSASLRGELFFVHLLRGDTSAAGQVAKQLAATNSGDAFASYLTAMSELVLGGTEWEQKGREFLATDHEYVPYIMMMMYASTPGEVQSSTRSLVEKWWTDVDTTTWRARLDGGDMSAWREVLVGYYLGKVPGDRLATALTTDEALRSSEFGKLPVPLQGLRCEFYFYDALLARSRGDVPHMKERLAGVLDTNYRLYYEYRMAQYLLRHPGL